MKKTKIITFLLIFFVTNQVWATDDFPVPEATETVSGYTGRISEDVTNKDTVICTWHKKSEWSITNSSFSAEAKATKVFIYHGGVWEDADNAGYVFERDADNKFIRFGVSTNWHSFDTAYFVFVSFVPANPTNNKIINGDFQSDDASFDSEYIEMEKHNSIRYLCEGCYTVAEGMDQITGVGLGCNKAQSSGRGKYFIANGNIDKGKTDMIVWSQEISSVNNPVSLYLVFSADVQNWSYSPYAQLQWYIDGTPFGEMQEVYGNKCDWKRISVIKKSEGLNDNITLSLRNMQTASGGNDFGLDDLFLGPVAAKCFVYRVFIGANTEAPDIIKVPLCPTLASNIEDIKDYIANNLGKTFKELKYKDEEAAKEALNHGGLIELEGTIESNSTYSGDFSNCGDLPQTSSIIHVNYSIDMEKEWKRSSPQQP